MTLRLLFSVIATIALLLASTPSGAAEKMKAVPQNSAGKSKPPPKESKEKGSTTDINIGVGELQESKGKPKLKKK